MPLRFRRRMTILPGMRLNFGLHGVSTSFGGRGAWFTVGPHGTRTTVGLPGSGLYYTTTGSRRRRAIPAESPPLDPAADPLSPGRPLIWKIAGSVFHLTVYALYGVIWLAVHLVWWTLALGGGIVAGLLLGSIAVIGSGGRRR